MWAPRLLLLAQQLERACTFGTGRQLGSVSGRRASRHRSSRLLTVSQSSLRVHVDSHLQANAAVQELPDSHSSEFGCHGVSSSSSCLPFRLPLTRRSCVSTCYSLRSLLSFLSRLGLWSRISAFLSSFRECHLLSDSSAKHMLAVWHMHACCVAQYSTWGACQATCTPYQAACGSTLLVE